MPGDLDGVGPLPEGAVAPSDDVGGRPKLNLGTGAHAPEAVVNSPHSLMLCEKVQLQMAGHPETDPQHAVAMVLPLMVVQGPNGPMPAMQMMDVGSHFVFSCQFIFDKHLFPELNKPAVFGADGQRTSTKKFDRALLLPPTLRMIVKPSALDYEIRRATVTLAELEGQSLTEEAVRERFDRAVSRSGGDPGAPPKGLGEAGGPGPARSEEEARAARHAAALGAIDQWVNDAATGEPPSGTPIDTDFAPENGDSGVSDDWKNDPDVERDETDEDEGGNHGA